MTVMVKERRLNKPEHVRALMQEQINLLRRNEELDPIERARAIGYLSNILLTAYREGEAMEKLENIERLMKESGVF